MASTLENYYRGKSILITGASSGLGWAVAEVLAPHGVTLGLLSRRQEKLEELAARVESLGSRAWIQTCDVQKRQAVFDAVAGFRDFAGRIDIAWLNSGISRSSYYHAWEWENIEAIVQTNVMGVIYGAKACADVMLEQQKGTIVAIGSVASMRGIPKHGIYAMSKIAVHYFIESLSAELPQLQFCIIHPGFVDTPINRGNPNRVFLLQPPQAARMMLQAVAKKKKVYIFPWQMRLTYHLVRMLPRSLYSRLARSMVGMRKQKSEAPG